MSPERKQIILNCQTNPENAAQTLVDMQLEIRELEAKVKDLEKQLKDALHLLFKSEGE